MLGKASEIKTFTLESNGSQYLHERINGWLELNSKVTVIDIKYGFAMTESERADSALIIYKVGDADAN